MKIKDIVNDQPVMKMHGCGNDFIVLTDREGRLLPDQVKKLCARHYGVGADGLIAVMPSRRPDATFRMKFFNPDGSVAEMCGNGIRCFAKYLADRGLVDRDGSLSVDTDAGLIKPELIGYSAREAQVKVNMGEPVLFNPQQVTVEPGEEGAVRGNAEGLWFTFVSMGNPHAVIFTDTPERDVAYFGPKIEGNSSLFPAKTNVEFVKIDSPQEFTMYVWERGAGVTLACGTGACAGFVAAAVNGYAKKSAFVRLPGGILHIAWEGIGSPVFMTGNAVNVFEISAESLDYYCCSGEA
ncbi:MAG: diaminopimelate epimerase [Spirochaetales bacterium]|nr:diaminopimelate epimerase [Spirochaetales bacterium]